MAEATTPFEMLGGGQIVREIVARFYALMDEDQGYAQLRALHAQDLSDVQKGLAQFLDAWLGGPRAWFDRGQCVVSLHGKIAISSEVADQWADAMTRAVTMQPGIDPALGKAMAERLGQMARGMVNAEPRADAA
ncbi:MAG: globin [Sphingobium sp.]